jgi:hypothetical protein
MLISADIGMCPPQLLLHFPYFFVNPKTFDSLLDENPFLHFNLTEIEMGKLITTFECKPGIW